VREPKPGWHEPGCDFLRVASAVVHTGLAGKPLCGRIRRSREVTHVSGMLRHRGAALERRCLDFNYDFHLSCKPQAVAAGRATYNLQQAPDWTANVQDLSGDSVFYLNDSGQIFHTYSTYGRGGEQFLVSIAISTSCLKVATKTARIIPSLTGPSRTTCTNGAEWSKATAGTTRPAAVRARMEKENRNEHARNNAETQDRFTRGMARSQQGAADQRKKVHARTRCTCRRAPSPSLGRSPNELCLRHSQRQENAGRTIRWPQPAVGLSPDVCAGLGSRLSRLLLCLRSFR